LDCHNRSRNNYEKLDVYQNSLDLVSKILRITRKFPRSERYELVSQIRRAAMSIPTNIVEGSSRRSTKEYLQFVSVAYGSCRELAIHLQIARSQNFICDSDYQEIETLRDRVGAMLWKLRRSLERKDP
jgi:four helix bundle protein